MSSLALTLARLAPLNDCITDPNGYICAFLLDVIGGFSAMLLGPVTGVVSVLLMKMCSGISFEGWLLPDPCSLPWGDLSSLLVIVLASLACLLTDLGGYSCLA